MNRFCCLHTCNHKFPSSKNKPFTDSTTEDSFFPFQVWISYISHWYQYIDPIHIWDNKACLIYRIPRNSPQKSKVKIIDFKEFNHLSTTMIAFGSLQNLRHFKSLVPSKLMPQKRNHDFTERYPNIKAGTYEPMRIKDILTKNRFFCRTPAF